MRMSCLSSVPQRNTLKKVTTISSAILPYPLFINSHTSYPHLADKMQLSPKIGLQAANESNQSVPNFRE
jgi:hypothetical protein